MKHKRPTHSERVRYRALVNGKPYPDNPLGLPYNNDGDLIVPAHRHNQVWPKIRRP